MLVKLALLKWRPVIRPYIQQLVAQQAHFFWGGKALEGEQQAFIVMAAVGEL